jgi:serine/threonine protein kinase
MKKSSDKFAEIEEIAEITEMIEKWEKWEILCETTDTFTCTVRISPNFQRVVKITPCKSIKRDGIIRDEMLKILEFDHPNIVKHTHLIQKEDLVYIEMEFISTSDLYDHATSGLETVHTKHRWMLEATRAVVYLHSKQIAHMDIKLENFLVTSTGSLKLIDFDFIVDFSDPDSYNRYYRGSVPYMSPQVMEGVNYEPPANDMWSLGVLLYILATNHMPFREDETERILNAKYYNPPGPYKKIIMYTITYPEQRRFTAPELLDELGKIVV